MNLGLTVLKYLFANNNVYFNFIHIFMFADYFSQLF